MTRGTKIKLDGVEHTLRYDLNAIAEIGERLGINVRLAHVNDDLLGRPLPLGALRTVIWAGLLREMPEVTEREVGAMIDMNDIPDVLNDFFGQLGETSPVPSLMNTMEGNQEDPEARASGENPTATEKK